MFHTSGSSLRDRAGPGWKRGRGREIYMTSRVIIEVEEAFYAGMKTFQPRLLSILG